MGYVDIAPETLLSLGFAAPEVTDQAWVTRWDTERDPAGLVRRTLPDTVAFETSGSTGTCRRWDRTREAVWAEAGLLADLVGPERPEAVVSFVPPVHVYGALATLLMPARMRLPVWYRSSFFGPLPQVDARRVVVVATPWIFTLLLQHLDWIRRLDHLTVLHSSAMLPATAADLLAEAGADRALIVEVLGSTETGGIATRRWRTGEPPPWTLLPDVSFACDGAGDGAAGPVQADVPLRIRSPRLASPPGGAPADAWETDDCVQVLDDRRFLFAGRRNRLVKVNGRRIDLDDVERSLRGVLDCVDLAVVPVADRMIGEHVDLLVVLKPGTGLRDLDLAGAFSRIGIRPRRVRLMPTIDRSPTGKLRHLQPSPTADAEVAT